MLMETTQKRLSTGKRVNSALDDPINFFAAQSHTQRASDLTLRKDGMSEAIQTLKAADNGIAAITSLVEQAKSVITAARSVTTSTDANTLEAQYDEILSQIDFVAADSGYKGTNLINDATGSLVVDFDENGDSKLSIAGVDASTGANGLNLTDSQNLGGGDFELVLELRVSRLPKHSTLLLKTWTGPSTLCAQTPRRCPRTCPS
jgi:flagellin-like hook-associated protein FlgL